MKKISSMLVHIIGFLGLIISINCYCPDGQICNCTTESIKCICPHREEITFKDDEAFAGEQIIISGCGKVKIMKLSLKNLLAESVFISDLLELYIESYAFEDSSVRKLHIYNISEFHLESYSLGNIKNIASLIISNVTLENIVPSILGDIGAQNVVIRNSHIGTIKSRALHMQNIESFLMENNIINAFDITSIAIKNVKTFNFTRNVVISTNFGSISLVEAEEVDFGYCTFRHIHSSMIVTRDVDIFSFHDCYVENCGERAFWSIQANNQVRFSNNQILLAYDDSLLPNLGPNPLDLHIIVNDNNSFVCDCELEWLLITKHPNYDFIRERSFCHEPPYLTDLKISQLILSLDNVGTCISVEPHTTTTVSTSTTTVTTKKERKFTSQPPIITPRVTKIHRKSDDSTPAKATKILPTQSETKERYTASSGYPYICNSLLLSSFYIFIIWWLQISVHFV